MRSVRQAQARAGPAKPHTSVAVGDKPQGPAPQGPGRGAVLRMPAQAAPIAVSMGPSRTSAFLAAQVPAAAPRSPMKRSSPQNITFLCSLEHHLFSFVLHFARFQIR